ncbi:MAG TPA: DUF6095 family protein [Flavobacterium sp.]|jgi:hypothetical protein|uniref:DUF6095 family protein n=1 Tax=Flavobacterium sp. TaxID=239 RepID=UPI002C0CDD44|nr:DUF6095 family protein [Flavobacterium sp.]MCA0347738.1 DUF6095 family protein [Bacteroidota bacterium]HPW98603.1 DUF6095 family protein [Flavobacterium sp.]HQA74524.1 DUF6095 family protein [Flavobacterium sp.]
MPTNRNLLNKGIKYLVYSIPLIFIGPTVIYNAFMNKHTNWHYLVLAIGCLMCLGAMFFIFLGIKTITDSLFNDDK